MYSVRFVLEIGGKPVISWPDCGWAQAWRLVHLFGRTSGEGSTYLYFDKPPKPPDLEPVEWNVCGSHLARVGLVLLAGEDLT